MPSTLATGGPTPGSLRGSGATDLYLNYVSISEIQWTGRWIRLQTLEFYLQEVAARTLLPRLPRTARDKIQALSEAAASVLNSVFESGSPGSWQARVSALQLPSPRQPGKLISDRLPRRNRKP